MGCLRYHPEMLPVLQLDTTNLRGKNIKTSNSDKHGFVWDFLIFAALIVFLEE